MEISRGMGRKHIYICLMHEQLCVKQQQMWQRSETPTNFYGHRNSKFCQKTKIIQAPAVDTDTAN